MRRRLARALIAIASATSLLLCVGVGVLWAGGGYRLFVARYNRVRVPAAGAYVFEAHSFDNTLCFELDRRNFAPAYLRGLTSSELQTFHVYYPPGLKVLLAGPRETLEMSPRTPGPRPGTSSSPAGPTSAPTPSSWRSVRGGAWRCCC